MPGTERAIVALPVLVRYLAPVTLNMAHEQVGEGHSFGLQHGECFQ